MAKIAAAVWRKVSRKLGRSDVKRGEKRMDGIERDEPLLAELANASVAGRASPPATERLGMI